MVNRFSFKNRKEYRRWLESNCQQEESIWIEFYKDGTRGITYQEALEESVSFGWIDSTIRRVDERIYIRKFSKRRKNSTWSETNKLLAEKLISNKHMTEIGMAAITEAKRNGQWEKKDTREDYYDVDGLRKILIRKIENISKFDELSDSLKKHYSLVYFYAKKEETRAKRLDQIIEYMTSRKRFL